MSPRLRCMKRQKKQTVLFQIGGRAPQKAIQKSTRGKPKKAIVPSPSMATATAVQNRKRTTARMSTGGKWRAPPKKKLALAPTIESSLAPQSVTLSPGKNRRGQRPVGRPRKSPALSPQKNKRPVGRPRKLVVPAPSKNKNPVGRPKKLVITPTGSTRTTGSVTMTSKKNPRRPVGRPRKTVNPAPSKKKGTTPPATDFPPPVIRRYTGPRFWFGTHKPIRRPDPEHPIAIDPPASAPVANAEAVTAPAATAPVATAPTPVRRNPYVTQALYDRQRATSRMSTGGRRAVYTKPCPTIPVHLLSEEE
ncbi:hypothetical protein GCK72_024788 [Caenorhabditis remanei]|uniref:Uncharacterized protein n=1 Tax=Caenorhabditis remanei TaxID=31234 RepID=A0A6A5G0P5_CAERE|nr:hypothetical protein GCK72_024788 [Caenorhabditis remanei]KAF1748321.1 hypothetical protein GCK72_024788 [Caenorhabditis remanei]